MFTELYPKLYPDDSWWNIVNKKTKNLSSANFLLLQASSLCFTIKVFPFSVQLLWNRIYSQLVSWQSAAVLFLFNKTPKTNSLRRPNSAKSVRNSHLQKKKPQKNKQIQTSMKVHYDCTPQLDATCDHNLSKAQVRASVVSAHAVSSKVCIFFYTFYFIVYSI